uniref:Uncharacterized protein n=1 Tax=Hyaloperonospora arabidopsidis (strain Emoy2) TaxID=559515 RepID=M4BAQ0_HYAAE
MAEPSAPQVFWILDVKALAIDSASPSLSLPGQELEHETPASSFPSTTHSR